MSRANQSVEILVKQNHTVSEVNDISIIVLFFVAFSFFQDTSPYFDFPISL